MILILFEESGKVRDAFRRRGFDAWSLDLLNGRGEFPEYHQVCNVWEVLAKTSQKVMESIELVIAFPPCTYLCVSGNAHHANSKNRELALADIRQLLGLKAPRIALGNPVGVISSEIRKPDQYIQPWQFGHPESKKTGLWLKNLPKLEPTEILALPKSGRWNNQTPSGQNKLGPSKDRAKLRSETYHGIAEAMAEQWGKIL